MKKKKFRLKNASLGSLYLKAAIFAILSVMTFESQQVKAQEKNIVPPFTQESAIEKLKANEQVWNTSDPEKIAILYATDAQWRDGINFIKGRAAIKAYLSAKFSKEKRFVTRKEVWGAKLSKNAIRFEDEWYDAATSQWYHGYGVEVILFDDRGLITERFASRSDKPITVAERALQ
jgi:nuclear transport factor 2 (NTF2) superfamily protein